MSDTTNQSNPFSKQPIINIVDDEVAKNISWEVSDGLDNANEIVHSDKSNNEKEETKKEELPVEDKIDEPLDDSIENVDSEEYGDKEDIEDEEKKKKKKAHNVPRDKRISGLIKEKKYYQTRAELLEKEIEEHKKQSLEYKKQNLDSYEQTLAAHIDNIKRALTNAKEEGDYKTETEATDLLAQYNAEKLRVAQEKQRYKEELNRQSYPQPQQNYYPEPEHYNPHQEKVSEWIKNNSWYDTNSPHFDHDMFEEADDFAHKLSKKYKLMGMADEIGSEDFLSQVSDHINEIYDVPIPQKKSSKQEKLIMNAPKSPVTPVSRSSNSPNAPRKPTIQDLTPEERKIAHGLFGVIRDERGNKIRDYKKCEEYYLAQKMRG